MFEETMIALNGYLVWIISNRSDNKITIRPINNYGTYPTLSDKAPRPEDTLNSAALVVWNITSEGTINLVFTHPLPGTTAQEENELLVARKNNYQLYLHFPFYVYDSCFKLF